MASYKINGYKILQVFGIVPDNDKTTANSFESPDDVEPGFSHDWGNGIIEYDLQGPVYAKPRILIIKGIMMADSIEDYNLKKMALESVLYQNYVTLEEEDLSIKYNARLRPGGVSWNRITNLSAEKVLVSIQFQFDEVKQTAPYKDDGLDDITFLVDNEMRFYSTQDNKLMII